MKVEGYIRFQVNVGPNVGGDSDYDAFTRGQVQFTAKSDTEYGPLTGIIVLQTNADNAAATAANSTHLDSAYLDIAGFRAGLFYSWWDDSLSGETDDIKSSITLHNSVRYQYQTGNFYAGLSVDELEDYSNDPNDFGVAFGIGGKTGAFGFQLTGGYDTDAEEGAVRAMATLAGGPGTIGLAVVYSSNPNAYYSAAQWAVAAEYALKVTDKLKLTPGFQYYGDYRSNAARTDFGPGDAWKAGLTIDYQIADNLYAKASVQYLNPDVGDDVTSGYLRLQRAF